MNLALPAVVVFALLLPGFVFRSRLKRVERTSIDYSPFGRAVTEAVIIAAAAHALCLVVVWFAFGRYLDLGLLLRLLAPGPAPLEAINAIAGQGQWIAEYFAVLYIASWLLPTAVRATITGLRLDREGHWLSPVARFRDAPWYYLLTGADFAADELPDCIQIAAVVEVGKSAILYRGTLEEWFVNPDDGQLDRLVLSAATRRLLADDKRPDAEDGEAPAPIGSIERFYEIDGDYFVLRYADIVSLNVQYVKFTEEAVEPSAVTPATTA